MVEEKFFKEALDILKTYYNDTDWDKLTEDLVPIMQRYKSELWVDLVMIVVAHLTRKYNYESAKKASKGD